MKSNRKDTSIKNGGLRNINGKLRCEDTQKKTRKRKRKKGKNKEKIVRRKAKKC